MFRYLFILLTLIMAQHCKSNVNTTSEKNTTEPKTNKPLDNMNTNLEYATFGGGCFWCMEAVFQQLNGVEKIESGFSGGQTKNPTYKEVCTGTTGHAEVIHITYDTTKVSFQELLKVFFTMHDPTTLNQQGNDVGTQYRSVVFYHNQEQKKETEQIIEALNQQKVYPNPVVTEIAPFTAFYIAEDYHQNYYNQNKEQSYCRFVIQPKIEKFEKIFKDKIKK